MTRQLDEAQLRRLLKEIVIEVLEERKDLFYKLVIEALKEVNGMERTETPERED